MSKEILLPLQCAKTSKQFNVVFKLDTQDGFYRINRIVPRNSVDILNSLNSGYGAQTSDNSGTSLTDIPIDRFKWANLSCPGCGRHHDDRLFSFQGLGLSCAEGSGKAEPKQTVSAQIAEPQARLTHDKAAAQSALPQTEMKMLPLPEALRLTHKK